MSQSRFTMGEVMDAVDYLFGGDSEDRLREYLTKTGEFEEVSIEPPIATMITLAGKPFRCHCGCNVFMKFSQTKFVCNACREEYQSE